MNGVRILDIALKRPCIYDLIHKNTRTIQVMYSVKMNTPPLTHLYSFHLEILDNLISKNQKPKVKSSE